MFRRVFLLILDGWGLAPASSSNAISLASTPNFTSLWSKYPHYRLKASGEAVGLPKGQIGNSEVGHLNLGAGRIVLQDLPRVNQAIADGSFYKNPALLTALSEAKKDQKPVHLIGLVSPGGVHSHEEHLYAILAACKNADINEVYIHVITDGRDVPPRSAINYVKKLESKIKELEVGVIATVMGRYYAMDRDNRWNRVEAAYDALVDARGRLFDTAEEAVLSSYSQGVSDEFIRPTVIEGTKRIKSGDTVIFFNFRSDRPREICHALMDTTFKSFSPRTKLKSLKLYTMAEYDPKLSVSGIFFPPAVVKNTLADELEDEGLKQFHIAETEKYAHVTYFFNGGREDSHKGEERTLIPSPHVATYDLKPEMSLFTVEKDLLEKLRGDFDFIVVNFANPDMVGHTGIIPAAVEACNVIDRALGEVVDAARGAGYTVLITADHGNIEKMINSDGSPDTAHTTNEVPLVLVTDELFHKTSVAEPKLANVAPTILSLMGLLIPSEMKEKPLFKEGR